MELLNSSTNVASASNLLQNAAQFQQQQNDVIFGLLTPGPSAELTASIMPKDLVPPMTLQPEMYSPAHAVSNVHLHSINPLRS